MRLDVDHRPVRSFAQPDTLGEAIALKADAGAEAAFVAGGTDLGVMMRRHIVHPDRLISLARVEELQRLEHADGRIFVSGGVRHRQVEQSPLFDGALVALSEACGTVGSLQTRNVGTIGGNLVNASPAADTPPVLIALGADVVLQGPAGRRSVPIDEFVVGYRRTVLHDDECLLRVEIPASVERTGTAFTKLGRRRAMEISVVCVAARIKLDEQGRCAEVGIGIGAVAPTPVRATDSEAVLQGQTPSPGLIEEAAEEARSAARPIDDHRSSAEYRRSVLGVLVRRTLATAVDRARQGGSP